MEKYKFVVLGDEWDVYQVAHRDWIEDPEICYIPTFRPAGLLGQINRIHLNPSINRIIPLPFKSCWNGYCFRDIEGARVCFLVTEHWLRMEGGLRVLPYLRSRYPDSRIVCFTQDMVATIYDHYTRRPIDLAYLRRYADLLISYDTTDAHEHHLLYHPTVFSSIDVAAQTAPALYDLYFLGRDKGRLRLLIDICHEAQRRRLKCHFLMVEVPKAQQVECEGITYLDGTLTYTENLRNCARSRCLVEMLQKDASSPTFRNWESIMLNKRLLTNNSAIKEADVYDERYITVFHDVSDIDWQAVQAGSLFTDGVNPYQEMIKPVSLIHFIEDRLHIQIAHS